MKIKNDSILRRGVKGGFLVNMTAKEKASSGRFPISLGVDFNGNFGLMQNILDPAPQSPYDFWRHRLANLRIKLKDPHVPQEEKLKLECRITDIFSTLSLTSIQLYDTIKTPLPGTTQSIVEKVKDLTNKLNQAVHKYDEDLSKKLIKELEDTLNYLLGRVGKYIDGDEQIEDVKALSAVSEGKNLLENDLQGKTLETAVTKYLKYEASSDTLLANALESINNGVKKLIPSTWGDIRSTRLGFTVQYRHTISDTQVVFDNEYWQKLDENLIVLSNSSWLIEYNTLFYDTDNLASYLVGNLYVPLQTKK